MWLSSIQPKPQLLSSVCKCDSAANMINYNRLVLGWRIGAYNLFLFPFYNARAHASLLLLLLAVSPTQLDYTSSLSGCQRFQSKESNHYSVTALIFITDGCHIPDCNAGVAHQHGVLHAPDDFPDCRLVWIDKCHTHHQ